MTLSGPPRGSSFGAAPLLRFSVFQGFRFCAQVSVKEEALMRMLRVLTMTGLMYAMWVVISLALQ